MRLTTLRLNGTTAAARVNEVPVSGADAHASWPLGTATVIDGYADLSALLADPDWRAVAETARGRQVSLADADFAPVVPRPGKVVAVGLNYRSHIKEMGRELPAHPTLFAKFAETLTGPYDDVVVPAYAAEQLDWEAELAFVIGKQAYQVAEADAADHIAGYTVINDFTMRDYQYRTLQWDQGKWFERTAGFGPFLDTDYRLGSRIEARLDGVVVQSATTDDLVFHPAALVEYLSHIVTLQPGDVVITGTTGGVGHARTPAVRIADGQTVEVTIDGLGTVRNRTIVK